MGNFCERLINVVSTVMLKLLAGIVWLVIPLHRRNASPRQATGEETDPASVV